MQEINIGKPEKEIGELTTGILKLAIPTQNLTLNDLRKMTNHIKTNRDQDIASNQVTK